MKGQALDIAIVALAAAGVVAVNVYIFAGGTLPAWLAVLVR